MEIEAYVIVSCPFNSYVEFNEFRKFIVNPFEIELAFGNLEWGAFVKSDFKSILDNKINIQED